MGLIVSSQLTASEDAYLYMVELCNVTNKINMKKCYTVPMLPDLSESVPVSRWHQSNRLDCLC